MRTRISTSLLTFSVAFGMVLALVAGSAAAFAQATPEGEEMLHPAHIHAGACPEVGDVVFPLENVVPADSDEGMMDSATPDAMSSPVADTGMSDTETALGSTTIVEASLEDILAAEHAINVHMSPEEMSVYVACGDITGTADAGKLMIDLEELNDSGLSGQATLMDNGDGTTTVVLELNHVSMSMEGTPESTPKP